MPAGRSAEQGACTSGGAFHRQSLLIHKCTTTQPVRHSQLGSKASALGNRLANVRNLTVAPDSCALQKMRSCRFTRIGADGGRLLQARCRSGLTPNATNKNKISRGKMAAAAALQVLPEASSRNISQPEFLVRR
jgi:hypothetical protein